MRGRKHTKHQLRILGLVTITWTTGQGKVYAVFDCPFTNKRYSFPAEDKFAGEQLVISHLEALRVTA